MLLLKVTFIIECQFIHTYALCCIIKKIYFICLLDVLHFKTYNSFKVFGSEYSKKSKVNIPICACSDHAHRGIMPNFNLLKQFSHITTHWLNSRSNLSLMFTTKERQETCRYNRQPQWCKFKVFTLSS